MFRALAAILLGFAALLAALSLPLWQFDLHFGIVYALCVAVTIGLALATERVIAWFHNVNQMLKRNQRCGVLIGE